MTVFITKIGLKTILLFDIRKRKPRYFVSQTRRN